MAKRLVKKPKNIPNQTKPRQSSRVQKACTATKRTIRSETSSRSSTRVLKLDTVLRKNHWPHTTSEKATRGRRSGEKTTCSSFVKYIHKAQPKKSNPAPVAKTARAHSSTPPCAATPNTISAQIPTRKNFMVWSAPPLQEPEPRHPPRWFP